MYRGQSLSTLTTGDDHDGAGKLARLGHGADGQQLSHGGGLARLGSHLEHLGVKVARAKEVDVDADAVPGRDVAGGVVPGEEAVVGDGGKVCAERKVGQELGHLAEAGEDDGVGDVGVQGREGVGHGRAERVSQVDGLVELVRDAAQLSAARRVRQGLEGRDFEKDLNLVDGIAVGGAADAQAVPGEG